jgi:hypothetical protein
MPLRSPQNSSWTPDVLKALWDWSTKAAPDPTPQQYYSDPNWSPITDMSQRAEELSKPPELAYRAPDPWEEARRNSETAFIDWASPTLGDLMSGRKEYEGAKTLAGIGSDAFGLFGPKMFGLKALMGAGAAGMVRMGGQDVSNAFLHRRIKNPEELDWLAKVLQRGETTQKPTSLITPGYMPTFRSDEFGVMFHGPENKIAHAGLEDVYSRKGVPDPYQKRLDSLMKSLDAAYERSEKKFSSQGKGDWNDFLLSSKADKYNELISDVESMMSDLGEKPKTKLGSILSIPETWTPKLTENLVDPKTTTVSDFFQQLSALVGRGPQNTSVLHHNEIIPNIDMSMLAGVRVPDRSAIKLMSPKEQELYRALIQFKEQLGLPAYSMFPSWTRDEQIKMLENPLTGIWKGSGTTEQPFFSSETGRLRGLR